MARGGSRANTGGYRPGSGRKPGVPNRKNAADNAFAEARGPMPKFVLLQEMHFHLARYDELQQEKRRDESWHAECSMALRAASLAAEKAAPYFHARLATHNVQAVYTLEPDTIRSLSDAQLLALEERFRDFVSLGEIEGSHIVGDVEDGA